jgi:hypothetical protein
MKCLAPKKMKIDGKAEIGAGAKAINSRVFPEAK